MTKPFYPGQWEATRRRLELSQQIAPTPKHDVWSLTVTAEGVWWTSVPEHGPVGPPRRATFYKDGQPVGLGPAMITHQVSDQLMYRVKVPSVPFDEVKVDGSVYAWDPAAL